MIEINGRFLTQNITGVQRYSHEFLWALDDLLDNDLNETVILLVPPNVEVIPKYKNIQYRKVGFGTGHFWEQFVLPFYVRGTNLICLGNTGPLLSILFKFKLFLTIHDLSSRYFPSAYSWKFRLSYQILNYFIVRFANKIVTVSEAERVSILGVYPFISDKLFAVQNGGVRDFDFFGELGFRDRGKYILYVGSLSLRKNFKGLLAAAEKLVISESLDFVFVGGVPNGISEYVSKIPAEVSDRIKFVGQVNDPKIIRDYFLNASCLLFPSFYEASPLPPVEAMAYGCPVVASNIPSLVERCGDAAIYCDPNSVQNICDTVHEVLAQPALYESLVEKGLKRASEYTWKACVVKTLTAFGLNMKG